MSNLLVSWIPDIVGETSIVAGIPNFEGEFPFVLWWLCLNRASQSTSKNGSTYQQTSVFPIETNVFRIFLGYDIPDTVCTIFRDNLISYCLLWIPSWSHDIPVISFYPHRFVMFCPRMESPNKPTFYHGWSVFCQLLVGGHKESIFRHTRTY